MVSKKVILGTGAAVVVIGIGVAASMGSNQNSEKKAKFTAAMVTDKGNGVDDKSFNQSAWEGMKAFGKANHLKRGQNGYDYFLSKTEADFKPNLQQATSAGFTTVAGVGFDLNQPISEIAKNNPKTKYILIDDKAKYKGDNLVSVLFDSQDSSYLVGVAMATKAKDLGVNKVGFIGGMVGDVIDRFQAGFEKGVASVDPNIKIDVQYADSYTDAPKGKLITRAMIANGTKLIYQAAGAVGNGVYTESKTYNSDLPKGSKDKVWVAGVDIDQAPEGAYKTADGKNDNLVLTSSLTNVGKGLQLINQQAKRGNFPGGKVITYGLKEGGVGVTKQNMTPDEKKAVNKAQHAIENGDIKVPLHPTHH